MQYLFFISSSNLSVFFYLFFVQMLPVLRNTVCNFEITVSTLWFLCLRRFVRWQVRRVRVSQTLQLVVENAMGYKSKIIRRWMRSTSQEWEGRGRKIAGSLVRSKGRDVPLYFESLGRASSSKTRCSLLIIGPQT